MANHFKTLYVGALNIVLQPHSAKIYAERFLTVSKLVRKDFESGFYYQKNGDGFLITGVRQVDKLDATKGFVGEVARFLNFDATVASQWLRLSDGKLAGTADIVDVNVPENLKPNLGIFQFGFYPRSHRLIFEVRSGGRAMSHNSMSGLFDYFFNHRLLPPGTISARIQVEQSHQMVSRILKLKDISYFDMRLARPNDLLTAEDEEAAFAAMSDAGIEEFSITLQRTTEKPIQLWDWLKRLAGWAGSNGSLSAVGYEGRKKVTLHTEKEPVTEKPRYDSRITTGGEAFRTEAPTIAARFAGDN